MHNYILEVIVLIGFTFSTRIPFLLGPSSDKANQLYMIRAHSWSQKIFRSVFPDSLRPGVICYPPLPGYFIRNVPQKNQIFIATLLNILFDVAHALLIYLILNVLFQNDQAFPIAFIFSLIFISLPILHPINARLLGIGARTLGPLLVTLYLISLFGVLYSDSAMFQLILGAICVLLTIIAILSSQFALQVLVFFSIIISIWEYSLYPAVIFLASVLLALSVGRLGVANQFRGKFWHISWYAGAVNQYIEYRNSISTFFGYIASIRSPRGVGRLAIYSLCSFTPTIVIFGVGAPLFIVASNWPSSHIHETPFLFFSLGVVVSGFISCAATMLGPLKIFGESERYIEYTSPFLIILAAALLESSGENLYLLIVLLIFNIVIVFANWSISFIAGIRRALSFDPDLEVSSLVDFLDRRVGRRVIVSPIVLTSELALRTKGQHKFLQIAVVDRDGRFRHWEEDIYSYPYLRGDAQHFVNQYSADTYVIDRVGLTVIRGINPSVGLDMFPISYENSRYIVFDIS